MAQAPILLTPLDPADVVATPNGKLGMFAGSDGKYYTKNAVGVAVEIGATKTDEVESIVSSVIASKLGNVDNTSDISKPVSTAQQFAIRLAQENAVLIARRQAVLDRASRAYRLPVPSNLGYTPRFNVYFDRAGYFTDFFFDDYLSASPSQIIYFAPDGDDGNSGASVEEPKRKLSTAIGELNAIAPTGIVRFILAPGWYENDVGINGMSINFDCEILCVDGIANIANTYSVVWSSTPHTTYTNTYIGSTVVTGNISAIDLTNVDSFGMPVRLTQKTATSGVDSTPGSAYGGSSIAMRTWDSRRPDTNVKVFHPNVVLNQTSAKRLVTRNVRLMGGDTTAIFNSSGTALRIFDGCAFAYAIAGNGIDAQEGAHEHIYSRSVAPYNRNDGFSARKNIKHSEIDCAGYWNGFVPVVTAGADNGTTVHDNAVGIRVNGRYLYNKDRNCHDIHSTNNWYLGCVAGYARIASSDKDKNSAFMFGRKGETDATYAKLQGCVSLGSVASDLAAYGGSVVDYTRSSFTNTDTDGTAVLNPVVDAFEDAYA